MKIKYNKKEKAEAITQILILIVGIVAISWMIGSEMGEVSAEGDPTNATKVPNPTTPKVTISTIASGITVADKTIDVYKKLAEAKDALAKSTPSTTATPSQVEAALKEAGLQGKWFLGGVHGVGEIGTMGIGGYIAIAAWAGIAFVIGRYVLGPMLGLNIQQSQSLGWALAGGTAAGMIALEIIGASSAGGPIGLAIGAAVAFALFSILAKKSSSDVIQQTCYEWDSASGKGLTEAQMKSRCEACNKQTGNLGCTEYQCRSLGQGCILINEMKTGNQLCIWNNTKDIAPPVIKTWEAALLDDFSYTPDNTISPPDRGVQIVYKNNKCAPPYTPVSFGVELDEPARCKISPLNLANYSIMADMFMGSGIRNYTHAFALSLPSKEAMEAANITVDNGGKYELYVRCQDANGNSNTGNFVFKFCIDEGPDTTAPNMLGANILNNSPIGFGQTSVNLSLYTNEPSDCKWSHLDKAYDAMEESMTCDKSVTEYNANMIYTCRGNLTGLKNAQNNKFYFRCRDNSSNQNTNTQSYVLNIIGTRPLIIDEVTPINGTTIEDSTESVKVELTAQTTAGFDEGKAICSFSETGSSGSYVDFFYGNNIEPFSQYQHTQELWLSSGKYTYYIRCRDMGGNIDDENVTFTVEIDKDSPIVVRVYKEEENLKIITDEPGTCVYSAFGCNYLFVDGTEISSISEKEFYTEWNTAINFYIKCEDEYGNQPLPDECSIVARPFEIAPLQ